MTGQSEEKPKRRASPFWRWFRIFLLAAILLILAGIVGFIQIMQPGQETLESGGVARTYRVHVPPGYDESAALPLVIMFHQMYSRSGEAEFTTHLNDIADQEGFIVAYADSYGSGWADEINIDEANSEGIDDIAFTTDLIDALSARYEIDPERIYATGHSGGASLVLLLACRSDRITGVVAVSALMPVDLSGECGPSRPVRVMFIHGSEDRADVPSQMLGPVLSLEESGRAWASIYGCEGEPVTRDLPDNGFDGTRVRWTDYRECADGAHVAVLNVEGGGHTWPGGSALMPTFTGRVSRDIDGGQVVWDFFSGE